MMFDFGKLPKRVYRLPLEAWLGSFKPVAGTPREKVHVQVRNGIAVNFIVELYSAGCGGHSPGNSANVTHERRGLAFTQVMKLYHVHPRY